MDFSQFLTLDMFGNVVGIIGMIFCLLAFFTVQKEKPNMVKYNLLNLCASIFLFVSLCIHRNIASMCLEVCWFSIALYGLAKIWLKKKKERQK